MANENLLFRKGTLSELLNSTPIEGSINFTTDEPAIYLDVAVEGIVEHKRIGDIIQFEYLSDFLKFRDDHNNNIPQSALYYIQKDKKDGADVIVNALLKWNGENYLQLNEKSDYSGSLDLLDSRVQALEGDVENLRTASNSQSSRLTAIEGILGSSEGEGTIVSRVTALENTIGNSESGLVADVSANAGKINNLTQRIETAEGTLEQKADKTVVESLTQQVGTKASQEDLNTTNQTVSQHTESINSINSSIGTLNETTAGHTTRIETLEGNVQNNSEEIARKANQSDLNATNQEVAKKANSSDLQALDARVVATETAIGNSESGLTKNVADLNVRLQTAEGTLENLPGELNATINEKINAANAMNYIGTLAPNEEGSVEWPTENVRAGDTYVASSDFYDAALGEKQVYAGDLLIASGTENENGIITEGLTWNVINTGYQAAHDQILSANENKIILSSHNNETTSVEVAGSNNINVTTDTTNNKIIINMVWGTFGQ